MADIGPGVRGALVAASWANLTLLPFWMYLLQPELSSAYWLRPSAETVWAPLIVVGLVAAAGGVIGLALRPRTASRWWIAVDFGFLAACFLALDSVRVLNSLWLPTVEWWAVRHRALAVILFAGGVGALLLWRRSFVRVGIRLLVIFSPFLVVTFGRAALVLWNTDFAALDPVPPHRVAAPMSPGRRIVVVVFDELDYGLAFERRPAWLRLPAFDRVRREGFFATAAHPPANATELSMPSLLTGRTIDAIVQRTPSSVFVQFAGENAVRDLAREATLFDDAAALGAPSELVGSFLPYCRWTLAVYTTRCLWLPMGRGGILDGPVSLWGAVLQQAVALAGPVAIRDRRIREVRQLTDASVRAASDPALRLVFLHLPVPHAPYLWDSRKAAFTRIRFRSADYLDNLALADRILDTLRRAMYEAKLGDRTALVVTSDHGFRSGAISGVMPDVRVPFVVVLPDGAGVEWTTPIPVVPLRPLLRALLSGEIRTTPQLSGWFGAGGVEQNIRRRKDP